MQQTLSITFPKQEIQTMVQQQAERHFEALTTGRRNCHDTNRDCDVVSCPFHRLESLEGLN